MNRWMTAFAFGGKCGGRGFEVGGQSLGAPREVAAEQVGEGGPWMPPATRPKKPRRVMPRGVAVSLLVRWVITPQSTYRNAAEFMSA